MAGERTVYRQDGSGAGFKDGSGTEGAHMQSLQVSSQNRISLTELDVGVSIRTGRSQAASCLMAPNPASMPDSPDIHQFCK